MPQSQPNQSNPGESRPATRTAPDAASSTDDSITIAEMFSRVRKGFFQIVGLGLVGLAIAAIGTAVLGQFQKTDTTARVTFSFPGFERGEYPDRSKFQADDLRAPANIAEALKREGLDTSEESQSKIRNAITVEGIIPDTIVKARDRLRAAGQTPPPYIPDEYAVTLTLDRSAPLSMAQRSHLLVGIVNVARENFKRTYGQLPIAFGSAFETLRGADLPEYEIVFSSEVANLTAYLATQNEVAKSFRSPTTNLSFKDLIEQVELFSQLQLNEVLGIIHENGLARNRQVAILKMDYYLRQLDYQEKHAIEDEKVVRDLLEQSRSRDQSYVLGVRSQVQTRPGETPLLDKGLIDSLMANDAYNFLVRQALSAGLKVKQLEADKLRMTELRDNLQRFAKSTEADQSSAMAQAQKSFTALETTYNRLVDNVRKTHADFANQEYGRAIQLTAQVTSSSPIRTLALAGLLGAFLGAVLGAGLSLLGIFVTTWSRA